MPNPVDMPQKQTKPNLGSPCPLPTAKKIIPQKP